VIHDRAAEPLAGLVPTLFDYYPMRFEARRPEPKRSRRSAFAVTSTVSPVSARIAFHRVVTPKTS
jgi:hypothetical protein